MKNLLLVLLVLIATAFFTTCKKENKVPTRTELITGNSWRMFEATCSPAITVSSLPFAVSDLYPFLPECVKDDYSIFYTNGIVTTFEGLLKCDSSAAPSYSGNWSFSENENKITISNFNGQQGSSTFDVVEITKDKMSFRQTINSVSDLVNYTDTNGIGSMVNIQPGTKFTISFIPK